MTMKAMSGLAVAVFAAAAGAQTLPEQAPARRPDGTIIYPGQAGARAGAADQTPVTRPDGTVVRPGTAGVLPPGTPEAVPARRPDGSVVYPPAAVERQRAPSSAVGDSARGAEERERRRQETQQAIEERAARARREREAAASSPARQLPSTSPR
jgi:hypothetical protein